MRLIKLQTNHPNPILKRGQFYMQSGQVLLLSTLILSSIIISVSFFVGYLIMQRLKQTTLSIDSAQAFYLSDSGIECALYAYKKGNGDLSGCSDFDPIRTGKVNVSSAVIGGSSDQVLGLDIKSTGCVGSDCKVSRSQEDTSQSIQRSSCADLNLACP